MFSPPNPYLSLDSRLASFVDLLERYGDERAAEMRERCEQACRALAERGSGRENIAWSIPWQSGILDAAAAIRALELK